MGVPALGPALKNPAACAIEGPVTESGVGGRGRRGRAEAPASVVVEVQPRMVSTFRGFLCLSCRRQLKVLLDAEWYGIEIL